MHILLIGCGLAGVSAALSLLKDPSIRITLLGKSQDITHNNSWMAQGGIIGNSLQDTKELLIQDILQAGDFKNNLRAVTQLAEKGPNLVEKILKNTLSIPFDNTLGLEGAHSVPRIWKTKDHTGASLMEKSIAYLKTFPQITWKLGCRAVDLLMHDGICYGASVLENETLHHIFADYTIIATGGVGQVYPITSNPLDATGDGIAMAKRAGAILSNMEYIQFHPTVLAVDANPKPLISESVRGHGALLKNKDQIAFMEEYNPQWKDLAPRDEVSRAEYLEMQKTKAKNLFLDIHTLLPKEEIRTLFPKIYETCRSFGIDISTEDIPVFPAAHYLCGGVQCDLFGQTTLKHLFCIGESSCTGVHGANRLASTSLLEALVWGTQCGEKIKSEKEILNLVHFSNNREEKEALPSSLAKKYIQDIQTIMWNYVGIIRTSKGLQTAHEELTTMQNTIETLFANHALSEETITVRNLAEVAKSIAEAAFANTESAGCHFVI